MAVRGEAVLNRQRQRAATAPRTTQFGEPGGADPREAGRRGGVASGASRRQRRSRLLQDGLEAVVVNSRNGQAAARVYASLEARDRERLAERERAVSQREDELEVETALLRQLLNGTEPLREERDAIREQRDQMRSEVFEMRFERRQLETDLAELKRTIAELAAEHGLTLEIVEDGDDAA